MERLGRIFSQIAQRFLPDPLVLAILLTLLVLAVAWLAPQSDLVCATAGLGRMTGVTALWVDGIASLEFLAFALQMCMILLTGFGLAKAPPASRLLDAVAGAARSNRGAVALVALVSCVGCWINWGFGLVVAGLLAARVRERLAESRIPCQYPLVVAAAYVGMMIWHGGLSGSAPLKVTEGIEGLTGSITIDQTILSSANLALTAVLFLGIPLVIGRMAARHAAPDEGPGEDLAPPPEPPHRPTGLTAGEASGPSTPPAPADRLNRARWLRYMIVGVALAALAARLWDKGWAAVNLTFVNLLFLALGLMLHRDVLSYAAAISEGGRAVTGIVIQFPLYAGIQGVMDGAGLAAAVSHFFVNLSNYTGETLGVGPAFTLPTATFFSAAVVNLFIPSGGGQWIVQGPIMCSAAQQLHLPLGQTVMAVAYGDQLTNMIQPFWAIPLMGLTRVDPRRFMGYCALLMLLAAPLFILALLWH